MVMKPDLLDWFVGDEGWWELQGKVFATLALWGGSGLLLFWAVVSLAEAGQ
jgi:hypothetical protein